MLCSRKPRARAKSSTPGSNRICCYGPVTLPGWCGPVRWSEPQYVATRDRCVQRIMRSVVPGVAPFSGPVETVARRWRVRRCHTLRLERPTRNGAHAPDWLKMQRQMNACEQQTFAMIDDAWGVLLDLAALIRARKTAFDSYQGITPTIGRWPVFSSP